MSVEKIVENLEDKAIALLLANDDFMIELQSQIEELLRPHLEGFEELRYTRQNNIGVFDSIPEISDSTNEIDIRMNHFLSSWILTRLELDFTYKDGEFIWGDFL
jgi:hypothetical protein